MEQAMTPYGSDMMPFTIAQFVLIGVFALLAIAAILYGGGARPRRRRSRSIATPRTHHAWRRPRLCRRPH
jgi:hypothetical protein